MAFYVKRSHYFIDVFDIMCDVCDVCNVSDTLQGHVYRLTKQTGWSTRGSVRADTVGTCFAMD